VLRLRASGCRQNDSRLFLSRAVKGRDIAYAANQRGPTAVDNCVYSGVTVFTVTGTYTNFYKLVVLNCTIDFVE
jgi:hypothetical protein